MAIVGFNFTQITAERTGVPKGKIEIKNNITIKNIAKANINMGNNMKDGLRYEFEATIKYEPGIGNLIFKGDFLDMDTPDKVKHILEMWKKDKKLPDEAKNSVLAYIMHKILVEAILITRDVNLPAPIKMGQAAVAKQGKYIG